MKNVLVFVSFLCLFLYVSSGRLSVKAEICGFGTYEKVDEQECIKANWENGCKVSSWGEKTTCITDNDNKCTALYNWSGCYVVWDRDKYKCKYEVNSSTLPCGVYGGGGGGGGNYEYTRCPEGQVLSCGTVAEAGSQNKKRPADGFAKRISGWESPHPIIRLSA
jgi:hypothetical protein